MTTVHPPVPDRTRPSLMRWVVPLVLLAGLGVGTGVTALALGGGDDAPTSASDTSGASTTSVASLFQVQSSCDDWMGSSPSGLADDQWCDDMFAWMNDESGGSAMSSMMDSMMWQGSGQMGASCHKWADQSGGAAASGQRLCDEMVTWMDGHMSSRGGSWMMQGR